jgi:hypothetical protein
MRGSEPAGVLLTQIHTAAPLRPDPLEVGPEIVPRAHATTYLSPVIATNTGGAPGEPLSWGAGGACASR